MRIAQWHCVLGNTSPRSLSHVRHPSVVDPGARHRCRRARPLHRMAPRPAGRAGDRRRQDRRRRRRVRHRLRRRAQQLLPAGDERADGRLRRGLGVRSAGAYHYHGVGYIALGPQSRRATSASVFERQQRIGYRRAASSALRRSTQHMKSALPATGARRASRSACTSTRRLRLQQRVDVRARRQGARGGRPDLLGRRGDGLRARRRPAPSRVVDTEPGRHRRRAGRDRRRPLGRDASGGCSACRTGSTSARPTATVVHDLADVDVLVPAGGRDRRRPGSVRHRRRRDAAGDPRRHRRAAAHRRRAARSPTSSGASTSSPTAGRSRAAPRRSRWTPTFDVDPYPTRHVDAALRRHVVRGALALPEALRGLPDVLPQRAAPAVSARSRSTTSPCSTT